MGQKLDSCGAALQLWQRRPEDHVYHELYRGFEFQPPQGNEERLCPKSALPSLTELYKKWANRPVPNWAMVRNQLSMDTGMQARIMKYEKY